MVEQADAQYATLRKQKTPIFAIDIWVIMKHKNKIMNYKGILTIEPGKRSGKPCIRGMRITVDDILGYLAAGMSEKDILKDFPELTKDDILACLQFAADSEKKTLYYLSK